MTSIPSLNATASDDHVFDPSDAGDVIAAPVEDRCDDDTVIEADVAVENPCENCGGENSPNFTVCRHCGYYAVLGTFLDVSDWSGGDVQEDEEEAKPESHLDVWIRLLPKLMPKWAWIVVGAVCLVLGTSVAVRLATPATGNLRIIWSVSQLGIGCFTLLLLHCFVYARNIMDDAERNLMDFVIRPLACWGPTFARLPASVSTVALGAAAITAVVSSFLIIGALPYEKLWDWGPTQKPKSSLIGAVAKQAKKSNPKSQSLEDAVKDFADEGAVDGAAGAPTPPPKPEVKVDCVIFGYTLHTERGKGIRSLLLATTVGNELKEVGTLSSGIPADVREDLNRRLPQMRRTKPIVYSNTPAYWVEPRITLRVACERQTKSGNLVAPRFDAKLQELRWP